MRINNLHTKLKNRCPKCKQVLTLGEKRRFTNTAEHCLDPNDEYERPLRDTYVCKNCLPENVAYWDEDGGFYTIDWEATRKVFNWEDSSEAIFSWDWFYTHFDEKINRWWIIKLYRNLQWYWLGYKKKLHPHLQKIYDDYK